MVQYQELIDSLGGDNGDYEASFKALVNAESQAVPFLLEALRTHENATTREVCAEILRERGSASAVPALIDALQDASLSVREDALWAIEALCGYENGGLSDWLHLDPADPAGLYPKMSRWWEKNREFIEGNGLLGW